jgi:hypothetical protein
VCDEFDWMIDRYIVPFAFALIVLGMLFLAIAPIYERVLFGQNDFASFYVGAKLVGTPALYSRDSNMKLIADTVGMNFVGTTYIRPPYYASFLKPIALLPYLPAYILFQLTVVASIVWFVARFRKDCPALPYLAVPFIPLYITLQNGQDTPYLLALIGAFVLLYRQKRDFSAGLILAACTLKFHLFLFVPVVLVMKNRWRIITGGVCGVAMLGLVGLLIAGSDSYRQWVSVLRDPWISPCPEGLPNIHGLALSLHGGIAWEILTAAVIGLIFVWCVRKTENVEVLVAMAIVGGLLVSFHSGMSDDVLLLLAFVLAFKSTTDKFLRIVSATTLSPIPHLMVLVGSPLSIAVPVLLLVWFFRAAYLVNAAPKPTVI